MEIFEIKNLSFSYPLMEEKSIHNINLRIEEGEFVLLCGLSGSGKTTFLRMLKKELTPHGSKSGEILFRGNKLAELEDSSRIGFVFQNPDTQIVTDKVWHELAFGLENMGLSSDEIQRRIAEITHYFGINTIFDKNTFELSGGQKQLVNLAAVMVMNPDVIILDEPTAQLDTIAKANLLEMVASINRDFGVTVILCEHNLDHALRLASRVIMMHESEVIIDTSPEKFADELYEMDNNHFMIKALPATYRILRELGMSADASVSVAKARSLMRENFNPTVRRITVKDVETRDSILQCKDIWFRYNRDGDDVIRNLNLSVCKGEVLSILGANGCGKTTLLGVLSRTYRPYRGSVYLEGENIKKMDNRKLYISGISTLSQNPEHMFITRKVIDDINEVGKVFDIGNFEEKRDNLSRVLGISHLFERNPYDLSGGEKQKLALVKVLLSDPKVILLDEPTKGIDDYSKDNLTRLILELKKEGKTVIIVTHDSEFAASVSDRVCMYFDGRLIGLSDVNTFFSDNNYYTTPASIISRGVLDNAVKDSEVIDMCLDRYYEKSH